KNPIDHSAVLITQILPDGANQYNSTARKVKIMYIIVTGARLPLNSLSLIIPHNSVPGIAASSYTDADQAASEAENPFASCKNVGAQLMIPFRTKYTKALAIAINHNNLLLNTYLKKISFAVNSFSWDSS